MKRRQLERSKKSKGELKEQSQQQRQNDEYSDMQGGNTKKCVHVAAGIFLIGTFFTSLYFVL